MTNSPLFDRNVSIDFVSSERVKVASVCEEFGGEFPSKITWFEILFVFFKEKSEEPFLSLRVSRRKFNNDIDKISKRFLQIYSINVLRVFLQNFLLDKLRSCYYLGRY